MLWKVLIFLAMSAIIVLSFVTPAPQQQIGAASRIFYYHIPMAWICVIAFAMAMVYSIRYLWKRNIVDDDKAAESARLGLVFCTLAAITGSIFAKVTWGSFWNWDPRQTSIFILLLIYGAYFALRSAVETEEKRAALAAVYAIFAFITVPFLIFVVPRVLPSLHPGDSVINQKLEFTMGVTVRWIFISSLVVFLLLYLWMFNLARRVSIIRRVQMEKEE
ncbi:MAG: cytochrome c biogenesis protein [Candidatus Zixiibacteriota bacterium]